jgi:DNA-binding NtrC family response regulator
MHQHTGSGSSRTTLSPSILLIDDDPTVCESLRRVLAAEGWQVTAARTGEEALERLCENEPDLMITDLCMKPMNGWDLLFHESLQRPHLPIFVVTALSREAADGAAQIATEFFQKPVDLDVLLAAARRYLEGPSSGGRSRVSLSVGNDSESLESGGKQVTEFRQRNNQRHDRTPTNKSHNTLRE